MKNNEMLNYLSKISILYVEDDINTREELEFFLSKKVKKLHTAKNGLEGIKKFEENSIDIVISDIKMPLLNGIDMAIEIKKQNPDIPIILITAFNDLNYLFDSIKVGISDYLTKPLNLKELVDILVKKSKNIVLEKENKKILNILQQYKDIVDERCIVSKTDKFGKITYVNRPFELISGYSKEELLGNTHNIVRDLETKKEFYEDIWNTILSKKVWSGIIKNRNKNGNYYIVDTIIKPILDINGEIIEFISLRNDITDISKIYEDKNQIYKE